MARKYDHVRKTTQEREKYYQDISQIDYEPTVDKSLDFDRSATPGEDLTKPSRIRSRPINVKQRIQDHIQNNWILWICGLVIIITGFFAIEAKVNNARLETITSINCTNLSKLEDDYFENTELNHTQDMIIIQNTFNIEHIQNSIALLETRLFDLMSRE